MANDNWPDWADAGKRVKITVDSVDIIGTLYVEDFDFDGEEEYPIFAVIDDNQVQHSFAMNDDWCFL